MLLFSLLLSFLSFTTTAFSTQEVAPTLYLSTDQGNSWAGFMQGLPEGTQPRNLVEDAGNLYLSTSGAGVFVLKNNQDTWEPINNDLDFAQDFFQPTALAVQDEVIVMGTWAHGVFYSLDGGTSWQQPVIDIPGHARTLLFTDKGLLAGTDRGLFYSFDRGNSWMPANKDKHSLNAITLHQDKLILAQQNGMGVLRDNEIIWSEMESDWALLQLTSQGAYVYATNAMQEVFRSKDGLQWEARPEKSTPSSECNTLTEALWQDIRPILPKDLKKSTLIETSRGWIAMAGGGC